jgi:aerobic-type carbon monoxide dehydrogenase small subunit (CoxS/CutS family)
MRQRASSARSDVPHYSCSILTHTVRDRKVLTIEGLASADGTLHPMQQCIVEEQGFQCAFCMSGFVMAMVGFLNSAVDLRQGYQEGVIHLSNGPAW